MESNVLAENLHHHYTIPRCPKTLVPNSDFPTYLRLAAMKMWMGGRPGEQGGSSAAGRAGRRPSRFEGQLWSDAAVVNSREGHDAIGILLETKHSNGRIR